LQVEIHGRQRRTAFGGEHLPVVVADERDVVRDALAQVMDGVWIIPGLMEAGLSGGRSSPGGWL
jgi:hypothetical protein